MEVSRIETAKSGRFPLGRQSSLAPSDGSSSFGKSDDASLIPDEFDSTLQLLFQASKGDVEGIKVLLAEGVDVNGVDFDDRTALHVAACEGHSNVVDLLLQRGANVDAKDRWGSTALADAIHYKNEDVCKILKKHGAKLLENGHEASMRVSNPLEIPDYEVNPEELDFGNRTELTKTTIVVKWRGIKVVAELLKDSMMNGEEKLITFRAELALLQKLRHPNVVQFLGAVTQSTPMMIIVEYLPKGDLEHYLKLKGRLKTLKALGFALDIARGMNYLHEHKPEAIIHRDLKPKKILRDESGHLKVADFGLSKVLNCASETIQENQPVPYEDSSCRYMAPELYSGKPYDRKVDVFSFGLILQEMIEGCSPFSSMANKEVAAAYAERDLRPPFKASHRHYPADLKRLIEECWNKDPQKRPDFKDIIDRLDRIKYLCSRRAVWRVAAFCSQF